MRILIVGSGGREHALAWKLSQDANVLCCPGNPGIAEDVETADVSASDRVGIIALARSFRADLTIVGPEDPLIEGLADALDEAGIRCYGPVASAAKLEGSKAYSKEVMRQAGVPTAEACTFTDASRAVRFAARMFASGRQVAVKASGNALGKGVTVATSLDEAEEAIRAMMVRRTLGQAGETVVVEERLLGRELSLVTLVGESNFASLPVAQDYKRIWDGDLGPNTGGMGSFCPCAWVSSDTVSSIESEMVAPVISALAAEGVAFRGTLFTGVMVTQDGPKCLEFNVRFGDPETQSQMMLLGKGLAEALMAAAAGDRVVAPQVLPQSAVTVVLASGGYPGSYRKGLPIEIGELPKGIKLFHAGTAVQDGRLVTAGGRVLAVSAIAPKLEEARSLAYEAVGQVRFADSVHRRDVGAD